jgi:hypothetical protein
MRANVSKPEKACTMADRETTAAIILAGLLVKAQGTSQTPAQLIPDAVAAADELIKALETSPNLTGPVGFTSHNDDVPPPGTP